MPDAIQIFFFLKSLKLVFTTAITLLDNYSPDRKKFKAISGYMTTLTIRTTECTRVPGLGFGKISIEKDKSSETQERKAKKRKLNNDKR